MNNQADLEATAYHEAGHAVAALALRVRFKHVTIIPNEEEGEAGHLELGRAHMNAMVTGADKVLRKHLIITLAGEACQAVREGGRLELPQGSYRSDRGTVGNLLLAYSPFDEVRQQVWFEEGEREALDLIRNRWSAVEAVASALLEHSRLSYAQVREIYAQAT